MYDVKYAPFADSYIGMAHGDTYEHVKRWLKQRFTFVDTLFDYAPSYNNDVLTIRANTTELMTLEIETYTPVYQHLSWYNGQMDKKKIDGKVSVEFSGTAQAATDQEVLIYGGSNVKSIKGITSMNPNRMLIGSATKLIEIDAHDCPLLADINANKANLSPHEYLNKVNLSNCPLLEGNLRLNNSPLVQEINIKGTNITGMNLPNSIRNLQTLRLPNTMTELTLNDASMLHTLEFDEGVNLQSVSMTNCNALENINFDLLQTPSITLNNSYNNVAELYFRDTTNLSLSNMANLERVIFTPNNEYETFELINVANAPDYKVTTFNCPKLSTFMTTAPYRESYNNCDVRDYHTYPLSYEVSNGYYKDGKFFNTSNETYYHYEVNISKYKNMIHHIKAISTTKQYQTIRCTYFNNSTWISTQLIDNSVNVDEDIAIPNGCNKIIFVCDDIVIQEVRIPYKVKDYDDIQPNTTFTANSIDISSTQFTDVKLLCTTDTNTLKLPTTVKNFYCDSSFDLDTDYLEDGEYDVVHGELIEPYTTDYKGEVFSEKLTTNTYQFVTKGSYYQGGGYVVQSSNSATTDFISVYEQQEITLISVNKGTYTNSVYVSYWDENKNVVVPTDKYYGENITEQGEILIFENTNIVIPNNVKYVRFGSIHGYYYSDLIFETIIRETPNLIPSSADGSLIFSMYAPSNTVAPASGIWDLKGLEFDNFHTFGMNNDVKGGVINKTVIEADETGRMVFDKNIKEFDVEFTYYRGSTDSYGNCGHILLYKNTNVVDSKNPGSISVYGNYIGKPNSVYSGRYFDTTPSLSNGKSANMRFHFDGTNITVYKNEVQQGIIPYANLYSNIGYNAYTDGIVRVYKYHDDITSYVSNVRLTYTTENPLTMPSRYDDYNITIKNANISPKTHNTMLYPLLVNEDNPITGTLDYTNYAGKHLSWSFAYTDEEYVDIIQPKEELINSYEYKYNAFYDTEYEFDNPYEVARYTSSASGVLPTFNAEFTYTYDEIDNGDGTYTTNIYADSLDNLPTRYVFKNLHVTEILKLNMSAVINMSEMFMQSHVTKVNLPSIGNNVTNFGRAFQGCSYLTEIKGIENWDASNVIGMGYMFYGCSKLTSLDLSNFDTSKLTNMVYMFDGCTGLTSLNLNNFDTSKVTVMNNMFSNCTSLTSLNLNSFNTSEVTNMSNMFNNCNKLTSLDLSGFDTSKVTNMSNMFYKCNSLTSLDLSGFDTSEVIYMYYMFYGCNKLTSLDVSGFDTSNVTEMWDMFADCNSLTSLDVSGFDTSNVISMSGMFVGCNNLTSLDVSGFDTSNVTDMSVMFYYCSKLTSLDVSGFDMSKVTDMGDMFRGCSALTSLNVTNWSLDKVNTIIPQLSVSPSTSTLYGSVVIDKTKLPGGWVYVFDDINVFLQFTASVNSTSLVTFNTSFTEYDVSVISLENNLYQYTYQYTGSNKPTYMTFYSSSETSYSYAIKSIEKLVLTNASYMANMFRECSGLTSIDLSRISISSSVDSMASMFRACTNLTKIIGLISLDTSNVTNMSNMFNGCSKLPSLDLRGFDTSNVISMSSMFANCGQLTSLDLSEFDTSNVTTMSYMFDSCIRLTSLNLSGFKTGKVTNMSHMFYRCEKLIELDSMQNIPAALDLSPTILDATSLLDVIDNLATLKVVVNEVNCTLIESGGTDMETGEIKSGTSCVSDETFYEVYAGKTYEINTNGSWLFVSYYYTNKAFRGSLYRGADNTNDSCIITPSENGYIRVSAVKAPNANTTITIKECILNNPQTLTLGSTLLAKLTEDQIAIAVNKGWTVA